MTHTEEPSLLDGDFIRATLASLRQPSDTLGDLFAERTMQIIYEMNSHDIQNMRVRIEQGVGLRRVREGRTQYYHTPHLSEKGVEELARQMQHELPMSPSLDNDEAATTETLPLSEMKRIACEAALEAERVHSSAQVTARIVSNWQTVQIGCANGTVRMEQRHHAALHVEVLLHEQKRMCKGKRSFGITPLSALAAHNRHVHLAREAAEAARAKLEAVSVPAGEMPVILGPGGPGVLLHEACGHALEADLAQQARSSFYGCLGKRVASPAITVIDDPQADHAAPLYSFDDEGEDAQPTFLIEQGILRNYLYDRRCALPHQSNGHGRRLSYKYPPLPRMSTTYVAAGTSNLQEMLAATPHGIFVQAISGGDTDMGSGRFHLQVEEGYLVEQGKITAPVQGLILAGNGPEILSSIDYVGDRCEFQHYSYLCNKLDQFPLVVSVGQPALRVAKLSVWGG